MSVLIRLLITRGMRPYTSIFWWIVYLMTSSIRFRLYNENHCELERAPLLNWIINHKEVPCNFWHLCSRVHDYFRKPLHVGYMYFHFNFFFMRVTRISLLPINIFCSNLVYWCRISFTISCSLRSMKKKSCFKIIFLLCTIQVPLLS